VLYPGWSLAPIWRMQMVNHIISCILLAGMLGRTDLAWAPAQPEKYVLRRYWLVHSCSARQALSSTGCIHLPTTWSKASLVSFNWSFHAFWQGGLYLLSVCEGSIKAAICNFLADLSKFP
jgi:hypothetical protein